MVLVYSLLAVFVLLTMGGVLWFFRGGDIIPPLITNKPGTDAHGMTFSYGHSCGQNADCVSNSCGKTTSSDGNVCCHFGSVGGWCKLVEETGTKVDHPKQCKTLEMFNGRCG